MIYNTDNVGYIKILVQIKSIKNSPMLLDTVILLIKILLNLKNVLHGTF